MPFLAKQHSSISNQDLLSWLFDEPQYDLDKPVYIDAADSSRSISGRQGRSIVRRVAAGLRIQGLQDGDCVVVASFNNIYYPILVLGIIAAGGIYSGFNPSFTPFEIAHRVNTVHGKFILTEPERLKAITDAKQDVPKERIFIFDNMGQAIPDGFRSWKTLLDHGEIDWPRFTDPNTSKTTNCMFMFSSGTTGLPKAVQITHHNLVAQHVLVSEDHPKPYEIRRLIALPMFHMSSTPIVMIAPFRQGVPTYIMRSFNLEPFLKYHQDYQITELVMVTPTAIEIIMSPLNKKYSLKSLKSVMCGAAPLDKGPQARFQALLAPDTPFTQVWGMTETSCIASMIPWPEHDITGSVGWMLNNLDVKLVDDDGRDISAPDTRGEICIRGPTITRGYYENEEANARDFDSEGFFHTGDIAYMDGKTGLWYIVDRKKELIKVRGLQVAPAELEAALLSHPSIIDAAVIGIPAPADSREGELPRAYVTQRPGTAKMSEKEVVEYAAGRLVEYKRLEGGVRFVEAIPKTVSGKILKRVLREWAAKDDRG
ncbi:acetyl-CoA synthetase-like protein [Periconia macrospinosa]|uniref:Acetyl-CoA synthetase-like protein n=1 Tax=Periconia macrospinosa TaxID=97972 RepID=A0A2V1CYL7_9PLEO|nr:acetyl-CoA synthetase-like protein [Periconia macrospinosa]